MDSNSNDKLLTEKLSRIFSTHKKCGMNCFTEMNTRLSEQTTQEWNEKCETSND